MWKVVILSLADTKHRFKALIKSLFNLHKHWVKHQDLYLKTVLKLEFTVMSWFDQCNKVQVRLGAGPWPGSRGEGFWSAHLQSQSLLSPDFMRWMLLVMFSASTSPPTHQQHPTFAVGESLPTLSQHLNWILWLVPSDPGGDHDWVKLTCVFKPPGLRGVGTVVLSQGLRNAKWLFLANLRNSRFPSLPQKLPLGSVGCQCQ